MKPKFIEFETVDNHRIQIGPQHVTTCFRRADHIPPDPPSHPIPVTRIYMDGDTAATEGNFWDVIGSVNDTVGRLRGN